VHHLDDVNAIHINAGQTIPAATQDNPSGPTRITAMNSTDLYPPSYSRRDQNRNGPDDASRAGLLTRAEMWMDERGKWAWIAAMVGGFIIFWPIGLALLAYMIWSKRMFSKHSHNEHDGNWAGCGGGRGMNRERFHAARAAARPSGNVAFDSYKSETLRRLEEEQHAFDEFLARLRHAKDKTEFDSFMDERAKKAPQDPGGEDRAA